MEKLTYYQVRVPGDGEFDWFEVDNEAHPFNPENLGDAKKVAEEVNGWVVKIVEERV